ncbi:unknown protein [Cronobacter turicensis z3032]|uniref:Uncharacterized protein n=1 Tax=Cronobacter turicensis (strain DSM 18703 / CCUG 55852 / LMG 23827 / z3032) TaxID=693216 RepID=C9Y2X6_CROTZ|nr:unknown protein [Cronobacter turicensis z3032]
MKLTPSRVLIGCVMFSVPELDGFLMGALNPPLFSVINQ